MNILFLSSDFVLPASRGLRVRVLSQLRVLASIEEVERIDLLSLTDAPVPTETVRELERLLPKVRAEAPVVQHLRLRGHPLAFLKFLRQRVVCGQPYLVAAHDSGEMRALIRQHLRTRRYDYVYVGYLGMTAYLPDVRELAPRAGVILEQHNVEWQIFDRLADSMRAPLRHAVRMEARALRRFERRALRRADAVVAISRPDAAGFRDLAGVSAVVVPPYVAPGRQRVETARAPRLGYIGHLGWQPNVFGLDWFCREVWPSVLRRAPAATLTIAGPGLRKGSSGALEVPPAWSMPGIKTVGFVDDLEDMYRDTLGMVAPVVGGSGVRMKLLETMSAGMPTVTTTDGAAGLGVADGREVLIADDPASFAESTARLLADADLRAHLRRGAHAFLEAEHSASVVRAALERSLSMARAQRGA
jgi:glycosyltransferase involved in cell wall biosynthesis